MKLQLQAAAVLAIGLSSHYAQGQALGEDALKAAAQSECGRHFWEKRGTAPAGFIKGMAASYAKTWCEASKSSDSVAAALAGTGFKPERDALVLYGKAGGSPEDRLRAIYALAISEGMRESSGNTTEGFDTKADKEKKRTAETAEAGLFQASHDSLGASPMLQKLWDHFVASPGDCNLSTFEEGIKKIDRPNVGSGKGAEFQRFTRACPAFAVEYAAVMMRARLNHFGPVMRKEAELLPACVAMFEQVEQAARPLCP